MGANLYTDIWKAALPDIMNALQDAFKTRQLTHIEMRKEDFEKVGNRDSYTFTLRYEDGATTRNGKAVGRDLQGVLGDYYPFKTFARGKSIAIRLDGKFTLWVECVKID